MRESQTHHIDKAQNLAIAVLAVCAVFLFTRTELFQLAWSALGVDFPLFPEARTVQTAAGPTALALPVRLAVSDGSGRRYGNTVLTTGSEAFVPVRPLFSQALDGDAPLQTGTRADFLRALDDVSVFCDFLHPLPLALTAGVLDAPEAREEGEIRCAVLARDLSRTVLFLWDGDGGYYRRDTEIAFADLEEAVSSYLLGNAWFSLDRAVPEEQTVAPLSLLPRTTPALPVLSATDGLADPDRLLTALRMNPRTNFRYSESNGTEVIMEGARSVRIRANGSVYYRSGGRTDLRIDCAGEVPTSWEAVRGCTALLDEVLPWGGVRAYPTGVQREGERTVVYFGYQWRGLPIRFSDGGSAAVAVLEGKAVSSLEIRARRYAATGETCLLLPLTQVLGIASQRPGAELSLAYVDGGGTVTQAQWLLD